MEPDDTAEVADEVASADDRSEPAGDPVGGQRVEDGKRGAEAKSAGPARRPAPPVELPATVSRATSSPSGSVKALQVALTDLGFFSGRVDGYYSQRVRNAVSKFQIALRDHGHFKGLPNGVYNRATYEAALEDPAFDIA